MPNSYIAKQKISLQKLQQKIKYDKRYAKNTVHPRP
jgi:hypothetical protein